MKKSVREQLIELYADGCKQIDDSPFISHKLTFFWRSAGATRSQGDMLKERLRHDLFDE